MVSFFWTILSSISSFTFELRDMIGNLEKRVTQNMTDVWSVNGNFILSFSRHSAPIQPKTVSICSWSFRAALGKSLWYRRRPGVSVKSVSDLTTSAHANTTSVGVAHLVEKKTINTKDPVLIIIDSFQNPDSSVTFWFVLFCCFLLYHFHFESYLF